MTQALNILSKEQQHPSKPIEKFEVPVFDKSVDYVGRVREQTGLLHKVQGLHEDHSADYLYMLKELLRSQKRLKMTVAQNEECLLLRKREEKLNHKELKKLMELQAICEGQAYEASKKV